MFQYFYLLLLLVSPLSAETISEYRIVMELSPPQQTLENGEITGDIPEKVRSAFSKANIPFRLEMYPWNRALELAKTEPNVFIVNIARTPERESLFKWVQVIHRYQLGLVALDDRSDLIIESLDDAKHYTIAVQRGDIAYQYLQNNGFSTVNNLFVTADITESWRLLSANKVDFVIDDPDNLAAMAKKTLADGQKATFVYPLEELALDTWLAAHKDMSTLVIKRIQSDGSVKNWNGN
ncbi:MAG: substrate-binding periplasmic protein [Aestuariibacter sp.]